MPLAKSPVASPYLSLSKLLYFTMATVKCISPRWAFGEELIEYNLGTIGDKVSINSAAIKNQKIIQESADHFGSQCIVVAVDAKKVKNDWYVFSHGGTKNTGLFALDWIEKVQKLGAGEIFLSILKVLK